YFAVLTGVFITAFYSFRMLFLAFHGPERFAEAGHHDDQQAPAAEAQHAHAASHDAGAEPHASDQHGPPHETPWVVTVPRILLAIPSVIAGWVLIEPMLFGTYFGNSIVVNVAGHPAMAEMKDEWHGVASFVVHAFTSLPFWFAVAGIVAAWYCYLLNPSLP